MGYLVGGGLGNKGGLPMGGCVIVGLGTDEIRFKMKCVSADNNRIRALEAQLKRKESCSCCKEVTIRMAVAYSVYPWAMYGHFVKNMHDFHNFEHDEMLPLDFSNDHNVIRLLWWSVVSHYSFVSDVDEFIEDIEDVFWFNIYLEDIMGAFCWRKISLVFYL